MIDTDFERHSWLAVRATIQTYMPNGDEPFVLHLNLAGTPDDMAAQLDERWPKFGEGIRAALRQLRFAQAGDGVPNGGLRG